MHDIETVDVPQANSLDKVGDLLALVSAGVDRKESLVEQLGLVAREIDYYKHAARILGFAENKTTGFTITEAGESYLRAIRPSEQRAILSDAVRSAKIFSELMKECGEADLTRENVASFLVRRTTLNATTAHRRADTILAWLETTAP